ncbi:ABC transporter related protein [Paraglaciecola sp. T6c]|uniref:ATP-binding cassette domain-containing protein n=1 Tax=Pseudoalteromonas atlantica (strain T6c / ATCC BAA-1087) TaxID=3042615 RepID=UPI00005C597C|nr:ATP-binding cassette domain-containing protein [Paraglaciecola sp. T6c]ABG38889.1 ABC transporter related protein [Paraglaciecola sp. T6c]
MLNARFPKKQVQLEIQKLSKSYDENQTALNNISLTLTPGIIGLVGSNGAGKSTLLKLIAQLERPSSGSIQLNGQDVADCPHLIRQRLGLLPQHFAVYENLTAKQFLQYLAAVKQVARTHVEQDISELLHALNLHEFENQKISTFSGGMRQRIGIAQALLGAPDILIFDEPTVGLDPHERVAFRSLLKKLAKDKIIILSSHIISDLASISDNILVLARGEVCAFNTPENLLQHMKGKVWDIMVENSEVRQIETLFKVCDTQSFDEKTRLRVIHDTPPNECASSIAPNLEDAYLFFTAPCPLQEH